MYILMSNRLIFDHSVYLCFNSRVFLALGLTYTSMNLSVSCKMWSNERVEVIIII